LLAASFASFGLFNPPYMPDASVKSSLQINVPPRPRELQLLTMGLPEREVRESSGYEFMKAICRVFGEAVSTMNCCMRAALVAESGPR
jgi:hypothetical protein